MRLGDEYGEKGGQYCRYVGSDVKECSIIAYLINANDENIEKPIGRLLIKPFINVKDNNDIILGDDKKVYGNDVRDILRNTVEKWLEEVNGKDKYGIYKLNQKLYKDGKEFITKGLSKEEQILFDLGIENFTINKDGSVDVEGNVNLSQRGLKKIPINFNKIGGYFSLSRNKITSLEGLPKEINGGLYLSDNQITSLKGLPEKINGSLYLSGNKITSLVGLPKEINGSLALFNNKITSLEGLPKKIDGNLDLGNNPVKFTKEEVRAVCDVKGGVIV